MILNEKQASKLASIKPKDLLLKNKEHDKLLNETLKKTEFEDLEGLQLYFKEKIECSFVDEYIDNLDNEKSLKNIVLIAQIKKLQYNYKENAKLILSSNKKSFIEFKEMIANAINNGLNLSIRPFNILLGKTNNKKEIIAIIEEYKDLFPELDIVIFQTIAKRLNNLNDIIEIFNIYLTPGIKLTTKTINTMIYMSDNLEEQLNIINKYGNKKELNIKTINLLIKNTTNLKQSFELIDKFNMTDLINTETINILLLKTKNNNERLEILKLIPLNKTLNLDTLSSLLFRIKDLTELNEYILFFDNNIKEEIKNKEKFEKHYFLNKIYGKFGFDNISEFHEHIVNIIVNISVDEINEDNWSDFI